MSPSANGYCRSEERMAPLTRSDAISHHPFSSGVAKVDAAFLFETTKTSIASRQITIIGSTRMPITDSRIPLFEQRMLGEVV